MFEAKISEYTHTGVGLQSKAVGDVDLGADRARYRHRRYATFFVIYMK